MVKLMRTLLLIAFSASCLLAAGDIPRALELVPAQFVGYGLLFLALASLFKLQYGRPFWKSLGWVSSPIGAGKAILFGTLLAFAIELIAVFLKTPDTDNPMKELLADRA